MKLPRSLRSLPPEGARSALGAARRALRSRFAKALLSPLGHSLPRVAA